MNDDSSDRSNDDSREGTQEMQPKVLSGRFRLGPVLGRGAMGVVHRAEQLDADGQALREVALKLVQPGLAQSDTAMQRFFREVRIAAKLSSPHTVTFYDAGTAEDGQIWFAMELVEGSTLQDMLRSGPFDTERAIEAGRQICAALAEAHGQPSPIVHRDLKPANIFVSQRFGDEIVKVADFGIAKSLGDDSLGLTQQGVSLGTPRYMSPEQWRGESIDGRADLYAFGHILFEMLTGKPPFAAGKDLVDLIRLHTGEPPPPLPDTVPAALRDLVDRLLAKSPEDRPASALEVRAVLAGIRLAPAAATGARQRTGVVDERTDVRRSAGPIREEDRLAAIAKARATPRHRRSGSPTSVARRPKVAPGPDQKRIPESALEKLAQPAEEVDFRSDYGSAPAESPAAPPPWLWIGGAAAAALAAVGGYFAFISP